MPRQRSLEERVREAKDKLNRLELQKRIAELREKVSRGKPRRRK